jgi:hypothetical protein
MTRRICSAYMRRVKRSSPKSFTAIAARVPDSR